MLAVPRPRPLPFAAGFVAAAVPFLFSGAFAGLGDQAGSARAAAAMTLLMAVWWLTEALPIYWTACVPLVVVPLLGILGRGPVGDAAGAVLPYLDPYIFLFAGGLAIAAGMEATGLHRRIALAVLAALGTRGERLIAGMLAATAAISLWISNTATAAMMLPIAIALVHSLEERRGGARLARFGMAVMLAVAWGANIGGLGTKIGTAPNAQLAGFLERQGRSISFVEFLALGLPLVLLLLPLAWLLLARLGRGDGPVDDARDEVRRERAALGRMGRAEALVLGVFLATAALWIASRPLTGWLAPRAQFALGSAHVEGTIAVIAGLVLLALRARGRAVLTLPQLARAPWETLLLLGGGFAMASAIQESGLSTWLAGRMAAVADLEPFTQVLLASVGAVALSAIASNTATTAILLVVLRDAVAPGVLETALVATAFAASCDFALPVGTPPNAIVFGSGYVRIPVMARYGAVLDLLAAFVVAVWCVFAVPLILR